MCGLAEASIAASVIGGVVQAYGQFQQGQSQKAEAEYRAALERNNSIRANQLAADALDRGEEDTREEALRGRLLIGQMRAVLAGSGQVVDEGTAGQLVIDQTETNALDEAKVRNNAAREAQEFRIQASQFSQSAELLQFSGDNAARAGAFAAGGTLLSTVGKVSGKWYQFRKEGALP